MTKLNVSILVTGLFFILTFNVHAQVFQSTDFRVLDPVLNSSSYSTSADYRLFSSITEISIGTSTITDFGINAGFLYFPFVTTPAVSTTAGDAQVALTWTASTGFLGWTVAGYNVGQSTTAGGPYTYSSVGNVLSSTRTGLTNGTTYYFVVRPEDVFGNAIATSTEVSGTPVAAASPAPTPPPSGGGGGGGPPLPTGAKVTFKGIAYPLSRVFVLKDGVLAVQTIAGGDARFETSITSLSAGGYNFGIYGEDPQGRKSTVFSFPLTVTANTDTTISGIFLTPTIDVDKIQVKKGDDIGILGYSASDAKLVISVNSHIEHFAQVSADPDGSYFYNFDTSPLELGGHTTKSKALAVNLSSGFGPLVSFLVGDRNIDKEPEKCPQRGDVNGDCRVNLVDFSITAYWWERVLTQEAKDKVDAKLWPDGIITLRDFSVMAFYWTG